MVIIKIRLSLLFMLWSVTTVSAQINNIEDQQQVVQAAIKKAYTASVRILGYDTVKQRQNSAQFSGVVVTDNGYILTVAHAIQPGKTYKVFFPEGKEAFAVALGRMGLREMQTRPDMGLIKITTPGNWPAASMGWSYNLQENQPCLSIAYPESLNQLQPTVRYGRISKIINQWGFIESTCKMEVGDSGGPLFDLEGRVIGLHSRCTEPENENFEVPVDMFRKYWEALNIPEDYTSIPDSTDWTKADPLQHVAETELADKPDNIAAALSPGLLHYCIKTESKVNGILQNAVGTIFDVNGSSYIIGKNSLTGDNPVVYWEQQPIKAGIVKRDTANDLVLLSVNSKLKTGISIKQLNENLKSQVIYPGKFLISPLPHPLMPKESIMGSRQFNLQRRFSAGYLGAPANFREGKIILGRLQPNSPAAIAGLRSGDNLTTINGVILTRPEDYGAQLTQYNPGDTINIKFIRTDSVMSIIAILGYQPQGNHPADKFDGGKSIRSDGFKQVFAHDPILKPQECGGPVFGIDGRFYGINIARFSRTAVLVIPPEILSPFITEALNQ